MNESWPVVWTIAGSDSSCGAGLQADLLTFHDFQVYACSVATAVTAQSNTALKHASILPKMLVFEQIAGLSVELMPKAVKLGMLGNEKIVETVCDFLSTFGGFVVCDPVLFSSNGRELLSRKGLFLLPELFPYCSVLTPNIFEAEKICGITISNANDVEKAACRLLHLGAKSVLLKGGHADFFPNDCRDYFTDGRESFWLSASRRSGSYHGSGCTLSAALAAALAKGYELKEALTLASAYLQKGLRLSQYGTVSHYGQKHYKAEDLPKIHTHTAFTSNAGVPWKGKLPAVYPIVDTAKWVEDLCHAGASMVQIRIKDLAADALREELIKAVAAARKTDTRLFVNDYWELAIELGADGVHLGQEDFKKADLQAVSRSGLLVGISTHSLWEMAQALTICPSYIAMGPVFATNSKEMSFAPLGVNQLKRWCDMTKNICPRFAIGGINEENATEVLSAGVDGIAMIASITRSKNWKKSFTNFVQMTGSATSAKRPCT